MKARTYDTDVEVTSDDDIELLLASTAIGQYSCCLLTGQSGNGLWAYFNQDLAVLFYFGEPEDVGYTANAPFDLSEKDLVAFRLENGQVDEYPLAITCPRTKAVAALVAFLQTETRPNSIPWFENG